MPAEKKIIFIFITHLIPEYSFPSCLVQIFILFLPDQVIYFQNPRSSPENHMVVTLSSPRFERF